MKRATIRRSVQFALMIAAISVPVSGVFDTSTIFLNEAAWYVGAALVVLIIFVGVLFDMLGIAAAAARETPFHAMAAKRIYGARQAIVIVRNAEKVASICSDMVGDIAGVLSGAGAMAVAGQLSKSLPMAGGYEEFVLIATTALATALTIGAKAVGKTIAIHSPTPIILWAARVIQSALFLTGRRPSRRRKRRPVMDPKRTG
ncbi:hypothetical protein GCM10010885_01910 [Alicyclobacillus cellulosilyticus]|uniref:CNNM transmembrane domain-containing protein n=1 Tax=Alicyclobacillus cellulosilyticus TaxID=1003997 RepID=A0A917K0A4_9BACL|nr:hypothetical protein [Alicyclobacillus cellulosilyticus]GGI95842.1 hypothetical protein GCM10010885_01910 [Alicyclobacillus cellulosilyticus]